MYLNRHAHVGQTNLPSLSFIMGFDHLIFDATSPLPWKVEGPLPSAEKKSAKKAPEKKSAKKAPSR